MCVADVSRSQDAAQAGPEGHTSGHHGDVRGEERDICRETTKYECFQDLEKVS